MEENLLVGHSSRICALAGRNRSQLHVTMVEIGQINDNAYSTIINKQHHLDPTRIPIPPYLLIIEFSMDVIATTVVDMAVLIWCPKWDKLWSSYWTILCQYFQPLGQKLTVPSPSLQIDCFSHPMGTLSFRGIQMELDPRCLDGITILQCWNQ